MLPFTNKKFILCILILKGEYGVLHDLNIKKSNPVVSWNEDKIDKIQGNTCTTPPPPLKMTVSQFCF